jgi:hypothetical protein
VLAHRQKYHQTIENEKNCQAKLDRVGSEIAQINQHKIQIREMEAQLASANATINGKNEMLAFERTENKRIKTQLDKG